MNGSAARPRRRRLGARSCRSATARRLFDSHCHIIDHRFPIVPNQGYTPPNFPLEDYLAQVKPLGVVAGAVVSGSFQANDQTYLIDTLPKLGTGWVGVTQIPNDYPDAEIAKLDAIGIRAVRFNVFRGRIDSVDDIVALANALPCGGGLAFRNLRRRGGAEAACRQARQAAAALHRPSRHDRGRPAGAARPRRRRLSR